MSRNFSHLLDRGVRDIFLEGLRVLDLLEITGSTATAARWAGCDQSSVSRTHRRVSEQLNLGFRKHAGRYRASRNLELLACLRQASQIHRLGRGAPWLQWVSHIELPLTQELLQHGGPMPRSWTDAQQTLTLLQRRVLDLAVIPATVIPAAVDAGAAAQLQAHGAGVTCQPMGELVLVMLEELQDHPAMRRLAAQIDSSATLGAPLPATAVR